MYVSKITKGEWNIKETPKGHSKISGQGWGGFCKVYNIIEDDIDSLYCLEAYKESKANAELIAEAGTITNQCGFSPKELLEQRNELLKALEGAIRIRDLWGVPSDAVCNSDNAGELLALSSMEKMFNEAIEKTNK